jgi:hypothetical protein
VTRTVPSAVALSLALAACSVFPLYGVQVTQQTTAMATTITLRVDGHDDPNTRGWLCPRDPGPGETLGAAGAARLDGLGCIDFGASDPYPGQTGWQFTFDPRRLPPDKLQGFAPGGTYRLLLIHGDDFSGGTYSADVPPFDLTP